MRRDLRWVSLLLHLLSEFIASIPTSFVNTSCFGVWDRVDKFTTAQRPFIKGTTFQRTWNDFEPYNGSYEFGTMRDSIERAARMGVCWYGMVWAGPNSPTWFRGVDVPEVYERGRPSWQNFSYPFYLNSAYKGYWYRMLRAVAGFLRSLPTNLTQVIAFWQVTTGCTGDEVAYKAQVDDIYAITTRAWDEFRIEGFVVIEDAFQQGPGRKIPLLFNEADPFDHPNVSAWLHQNIRSGLGVKGSAYVRQHHMSDEKEWIDYWRPFMINPRTTNNRGEVQLIFTRAEMDQTYTNPLYSLNRQMSFYWALLTGLNQGLAVHDVSLVPMDSCYSWGTAEDYTFFNKYAPQVFPETATGAFTALHEGLDGFDYIKFPEAIYGAVLRSIGGFRETQERLIAMCNARSSDGCRMDDPPSAIKGQVYQRDFQTGFNDAGFGIWPSNYERFLEQIDADNTTDGRFRIGGNITSTTVKYARFARALNHTANKTGMFFRLTDGFFNIYPVGAFVISIIWYDALPGSWQFEYAATTGEAKVAVDQIMFGDLTWKNASFEVHDIAMRHSHTRQSDFAITSRTQTDIVVHMIELTRIPTTTSTTKTTTTTTMQPTRQPTLFPTYAPTYAPTLAQSFSPRETPTDVPTLAPTNDPTCAPTHSPSLEVIVDPTNEPTEAPTLPSKSTLTEAPKLPPKPTPSDIQTQVLLDATLEPIISPADAPTTAPTITMTPTSDVTSSPTPDTTSSPTPDPTTSPTPDPTSSPIPDPPPSPSSLTSAGVTLASPHAPTLAPAAAPTMIAPAWALTSTHPGSLQPTPVPIGVPTPAHTLAPTPTALLIDAHSGGLHIAPTSTPTEIEPLQRTNQILSLSSTQEADISMQVPSGQLTRMPATGGIRGQEPLGFVAFTCLAITLFGYYIVTNHISG